MPTSKTFGYLTKHLIPGKIVQDKNSLTINSGDTSVSKATQLDYAIPASKIATLSSGEFVGVMADNPEQKIALKMFHSAIQNDHEAMAKEEAAFKNIPIVSYVNEETVAETHRQIKQEIVQLLSKELASINSSNTIKESHKSDIPPDVVEEKTVSI